ncbi:MAG: DUF86 domain-containing protein [Cyclobacteriaceae bacterium]|nr:DUF86 domain-containing protein [Cyclobacteriaceae bacterium]
MDDLVIQKAASIERCLARVKEEFENAGEGSDTNYTRQDAAILNLQRACEQTIDLSNHFIRINKWGIPATSKASFDILIENNFLPKELGERLKKMVGFRNIAVHEYGSLNITILRKIIVEHLIDFKEFCTLALKSMGDA